MLVAADAIVTDSESAASDVVRMLGVDPRVVTSIGVGTAEQFQPPTDSLAERMTELDRSRRHCCRLRPRTGGPEWRKNLDGAVEAYSRLPSELQARHQLVIASKIADGQHAKFHDYCSELGVADRVVVTGYVSDEHLVRLYQSAELVMFPSFYEGFGLPVLEARRCRARVITSNVSSLPEVMPEPAALFSPYEIDDMAERLESALTDSTYGPARRCSRPWLHVGPRRRPSGGGLPKSPHTEQPGRVLTSATRGPGSAVAPRGPRRGRANDGPGRPARCRCRYHRLRPVRSSRIAEDWQVDVQNVRVLPAHHAAGEYDAVVYTLGDEAIESATLAV